LKADSNYRPGNFTGTKTNPRSSRPSRKLGGQWSDRGGRCKSVVTGGVGVTISKTEKAIQNNNLELFRNITEQNNSIENNNL